MTEEPCVLDALNVPEIDGVLSKIEAIQPKFYDLPEFPRVT
jgi:hypothetical protein